MPVSPALRKGGAGLGIHLTNTVDGNILRHLIGGEPLMTVSEKFVPAHTSDILAHHYDRLDTLPDLVVRHINHACSNDRRVALENGLDFRASNPVALLNQA